MTGIARQPASSDVDAELIICDSQFLCSLVRLLGGSAQMTSAERGEGVSQILTKGRDVA